MLFVKRLVDTSAHMKVGGFYEFKKSSVVLFKLSCAAVIMLKSDAGLMLAATTTFSFL